MVPFPALVRRAGFPVFIAIPILLSDVFNLHLNLSSMFGKTEKKPKARDDTPYGGLDEVTDEEIDRNIRDYPYVLGKLKKC